MLTKLIDAGKISMREVERLAAGVDAEIAALEARLAQLRGTDAPDGSKRRGAGSRGASAHQRDSRRIQGEYMGLIRHLTPNERARIKKIAAERGREAAIREMRRH